MAKYLISTTEIYRVDTEREAAQAIEEAKKDSAYTLAKYTNEHKERKSKGEIIDEYWKLTLTKLFTDIKEPTMDVRVNYEVDYVD